MSEQIADEVVAEKEPAETTVDDIDPDQADLDEAKAAAKAETDAEDETDKDGTEVKEAEPVAEAEPAKAGEAPAPQEGGEAKPAAAAEPAAPKMVPIGRLNAVAKQRDEIALQAAYYKGQADLQAKQPAVAATGDAPVEKTPQEQIAGIREQKFALASELDEGSLSQREYAEKLSKLDDAEYEVRQAAIKPAPAADPAPAPAPVAPASDLYLDRLTADLEEAHPYLALIGDPTADAEAKERISHLAETARGQLTKEGVMVTADARGDYVVRERVAQLSDQYGPLWFPDAKPGQPVPAAGKDGLTPRQTATAAKVALAETQPPNTSGLGRADTGIDETVADIESKIISGKMSEDDIAALPSEVRAKIRGDSWDG